MKVRNARTSLAVGAALTVGVIFTLARRFFSRASVRRQPVFVLKSPASKIEVHISPVGCIVQKLLVPDRSGKVEDVVLGFDDMAQYLESSSPYFGAVVGRCANRIKAGQFQLDGKTYHLAKNNNGNALHGGLRGFDKRLWAGEQLDLPEGPAVRLTRLSPDGEEGYPGNLTATVTYILTPRGELRCRFEATTDAPTIVNMAQHSYFNLAGHSSGTVLDHEVMIGGDHYTPVDSTAIPTGEIAPVRNTPFDFTQTHRIGARIAEVPGPAPGGYDHNYVLHGAGRQAKFVTKLGANSETPRLAATVYEPRSGRSLAVLTTAPGMQFYSGNFLDGSLAGKDGVRYAKHAGFCMETQGFPDAVNQPAFPSVVLRPGEVYRHEAVYHMNYR